MAQPSPLGQQRPQVRVAGPNQWIKDQLDAVIDAELLPEPPRLPARIRCPARGAVAARVADRFRRAVAPEAAAGRTP